jgi:hypothetical protein
LVTKSASRTDRPKQTKEGYKQRLDQKLNFTHPPRGPVLSGLSARTGAKVTPRDPTGCIPEPQSQEYVALARSNQKTGCVEKFCNHITVELIRVIRLGPLKSRQIVRKRPAPAMAKTALPLDSGLWLMPHYICRQTASPRIQSPSLQPLSGFDSDFARCKQTAFYQNRFWGQ